MCGACQVALLRASALAFDKIAFLLAPALEECGEINGATTRWL